MFDIFYDSMCWLDSFWIFITSWHGHSRFDNITVIPVSYTHLHEKIWLKSGGFLVIQQTEAFVSIDVNSGKYTGKKKAEETYRKINLEAAAEIARQIRLRNLSGIILVDFINMENPDHQDELFHVLQKYLRKDPVKCKAIDITPLHILEMTRQKVRRPLIEDLRELSAK